MTSVNVYISPFGYDETTIVPRVEEVPRFTLGVTLTPNPGLFGGLAFALPLRDVRNFSVNLGYAVMLATVPAGSAAIGGTSTATRRGALGAWAAQLGYSF